MENTAIDNPVSIWLKKACGSIYLNLWRHQIYKVRVRDTIELVSAFAKIFKGQMELNTGSKGRIELIERWPL